MSARAAQPLGPDEGIDRGRPGSSARAEFERRQQADDRHRQEVFGRFLAPLVKAVAGERHATTAWNRGGRAEEKVGHYLSREVGLNGLVLHDRAVPASRGNIDHIAIVPSGVWIIDTKQYSGRVQQRSAGGWFVSRPVLFVNGRDRSSLIPAVLRQVAQVEKHVAADVPLHAALCFSDSEWGLLGRPFVIDGVHITWAHQLAGLLDEPGPLTVNTIRQLGAGIASTFPTYAPAGTSHSPTGA